MLLLTRWRPLSATLLMSFIVSARCTCFRVNSVKISVKASSLRQIDVLMYLSVLSYINYRAFLKITFILYFDWRLTESDIECHFQY